MLTIDDTSSAMDTASSVTTGAVNSPESLNTTPEVEWVRIQA